MKQSIRYILLAVLFIPFILVSCKTTGTDVVSDLTDTVVLVEEDLTEPATDYLLEALAEAEARAKESRSWAEYLNGPVHCPDEWKAAEERCEAADNRKDPPATKGEAYERIAEWNGIKLAYDEIFNGSFEAFLNEQQDVLAAARQKAVDAGAEELVPDRLAVADTYTKSSEEKFQGGDIYGSLNSGKEAWDRYRILETLALARAKQEEADANDLFSKDPDNYMLAAEAGNNSVDLYDEGDLVKSQAEANAALAGFTQVIRSLYMADVEEKASLARDARAAAQEIKAQIAVRSDYEAAESVYNQAHVALRADQYEEAKDLFDRSTGLYNIAYEKALEKRTIAEEALRRSEQKLAESEEFAQNAEDIIGEDSIEGDE